MARKKITIAAPKFTVFSMTYADKSARVEKTAIDVDALGAVLYKSLPSTATETDAADDSVSEN
ncbi:MAG: hypothetical protein IPH44_36605 [Myxococcales bacterium]|nr:hypothetical protein [Myxococcales bacterium]MBK7191080.1 hypothetical protein [Myxococcales bacterium]